MFGCKPVLSLFPSHSFLSDPLQYCIGSVMYRGECFSETKSDGVTPDSSKWPVSLCNVGTPSDIHGLLAVCRILLLAHPSIFILIQQL